MFLASDDKLAKERDLQTIDLVKDVLPLGRSKDGILEGFPKDVDFSKYFIHTYKIAHKMGIVNFFLNFSAFYP